MGKLGCALVAVVLAAGTAACENADGETADPSATSTTASAMPSPTPTGPTVPPLPDNAKGNTPEAAAHFVEHYIELMNYASSTGDVAPLEEVSADRCEGCNNYIDLYKKTYANGGYFKDSGWKPRGSIAESEGGHTTILVDVVTPDTVFKLKRSDQEKKGKGGRYELRFEAVRGNNSWQVSAFERQADLAGKS